ncbi:MAG: ribokinase [Bacillota bacterium]
MKKQADFVVLGSANVDYVAEVPHLPVDGETIQSDSFAIYAGGKGANQAAALARAEKDVIYLGAVGRDNNAEFMEKELQKYGVNTDYIFKKNIDTGVSIIAVAKNGNNFIITHAGANKELSISDIDGVLDILEESKYVLLHWDINIDAGEYFIKKAKELGNKIIFNLAPVRPISEEIFKMIDYLIINETEAAYLTDIKVQDAEDARKAGKILLDKIENIVITLGKSGAVVINKDTEKHLPSEKVKAVDSTAAGDTFIGVFASQLDEKGLIGAVKAANRAASISVTRYGALPSIPELAEYNS